jgi:hypothetical protein
VLEFYDARRDVRTIANAPTAPMASANAGALTG